MLHNMDNNHPYYSTFKVYNISSTLLIFVKNMRSLLKNENGFAQYVGAVVAILVVIVVGLVVYYKIAGSINGLPAAGVKPIGS